VRLRGERITRRVAAVATAITAGFVGWLAVPASSQDGGAITPTRDPNAVAAAIASPSAPVTGASFQTIPPNGDPVAVSTVPLTGFPTNGPSYGILTSGDAKLADDPNSSPSSGAVDGGGNVRGNTDRDVTILKIDLSVPAGANCLSFDFRFLSEEFPEFVGSSFNDAFIAELDNSNWTTEGSTINAPNNFAFDEQGNPISINSTGSTSVSAEAASGTTYDGATQLLQARTPITAGAHSLYLSIFDQGDSSYDSAAFVDNVALSQVPPENCTTGAQPPGGGNGGGPSGISIGDVSLEEGDEGTRSAVFTVSLTSPSSEPVGVDFATAPGTASAGSDFTSTSGHLDFAPGETSKTVVVPVVGDFVEEADENFTVNLSNATGAEIVDGQGVAIIVNDDPGAGAPTISIGDVSVVESDGTTTANFTLSLSGPSSEVVAVRHILSNVTAVAPDDYIVHNGIIAFDPGQVSKTLSITVNGDNDVEGDETFVVDLDNPENARIADARGVGTILDDDSGDAPPPPPPTPADADRDADLVADAADNCPTVANSNQADIDQDGIGDACDDSNGSLPPVAGVSVVVRVVSGQVFIDYPAGRGPAGFARSAQIRRGAQRGFVRLRGAANVPVGSVLDTEEGRVSLTSAADLRGRVQRADFYRGVFQVRQRRTRRPVTDLRLRTASFARGCPHRTSRSSRGHASRHSRKRLGRLFGNGRGRFRTRGRFSAATVRGTVWITEDRCDGTLTRVTTGRVSVFDFPRGRRVTLRAGDSYLARATRAAVRRSQRR
jgi:hypothetical protein